MSADTHPRMRIGELAERFDLNTRTIRYYESIGLMPEPARTASGYRLYSEADAERLGFIRSAQRLGLSLDDIGEILAFRDQGRAPCRYVLQVMRRQADDLERQIARLRRLRDELRALAASADELPAQPDGYCRIIEHHRGA